MKIITIVGARPQFVKAAALSRVLKTIKNIQEIIVHTGQHYDQNMSEVFFEEMQIPHPKYNLQINGLTQGAMTGQMMEEVEKVLIDEKPDLVLVYGDTNSTLAGALAAKKLHIKLAHVEAGLRSFNERMPEEINRILTDRISDYLFCPTSTALDNLKKEGFETFNSQIMITGDIMEDAAKHYAKFSAEKSSIAQSFKNEKYILCTLHRAENTNDPKKLAEIFEGIEAINKTTKIILPLHPRTKSKMKEFNISSSIDFIDPVGYFDMIELIQHSELVMTDSGGLQKEAYFFDKKCVTIRDQTEWTELIENGVNVLVNTTAMDIVNGVKQMQAAEVNFSKNLYGGGKAGQFIAEFFIKEFKL